MYQYIFFDLDGTLTDPREGITRSVQHALACMGIEEPDLTKLEPFIGPPLIDSFMEFYGFSREEARKGVEYYREYFSVTGLYQNKLFEGVPGMLAALKEHGRVVAIASSKPEPFVREILEHFQIGQYFDYVCGSTLDEKRTKKEEVIEELLRRMNLPEEELGKILMVGDRRHDVEGAAQFGIPCLGLSMGFAAEGELEKAGAAAVVDSMEELEQWLLL
ncbi:MAG: HAD hydrolase-like protein [Clostridiales bacterium]|nr:HAD hydrolase-like protein [Clostridiales bacterium]